MRELIVLNDTEGLTPTTWVFFTILLVAIVAVAICLGYFLIRKAFKKYLKRKIQDNTLIEYSSFILDFKTQTFQYFDVKSGSEIKSDKLSIFIDSLEVKEKQHFKQWINDLFNNNYRNGDKHLVALFNFKITESDLEHTTYKKYIFLSKKIVKEKQLLYLDIFRLDNMPLNLINDEYTFETQKNYYTTYDNFVSTYDKSLFANGGLILIQLNRKFGENERGYNRAVVEARIIDTLFEKSKIGINIVATREVNESSSQIYLLTTSTFNLYPLNILVDRITIKLKELFDISGYAEIFNFKTVAGKFNELPNDIKESIKLFSDIESLIEEEEKDYIIYHKNSQNNLLTSYSYKGAIDDVFKNNLISIQYRPIIQLHTEAEYTSLFGYTVELNVKNNYFKNYDEFKRLTSKVFRVQDRIDTETTLISNTLKTELNNKKQLLVYDVDLDSLESTTSSISSNKDKVVITINNNELDETDNNKEIKDTISSLKEEEYKLGLKLTVNVHNLKESIYHLFDFFFFDVSELNVKTIDQDFVLIRNLLERFVKYKKPLILLNCTSWQILNLFVKIGITHFSSDLISKGNTKLVGIERKIEKKLLKIGKNK